MAKKIVNYQIELILTNNEARILQSWCQNPWGDISPDEEEDDARSVRHKLWKELGIVDNVKDQIVFDDDVEICSDSTMDSAQDS